MKRVAIALAAALTAGAAQGVEQDDFVLDTAADLAALCSVSPSDVANDSARHMCLGFIVGVHQMHEAVESALNRGIYCVPVDAQPSRDDVAVAIAAWIKADPERGGLEAHDGVLIWAAETYPCE